MTQEERRIDNAKELLSSLKSEIHDVTKTLSSLLSEVDRSKRNVDAQNVLFSQKVNETASLGREIEDKKKKLISMEDEHNEHIKKREDAIEKKENGLKEKIAGFEQKKRSILSEINEEKELIFSLTASSASLQKEVRSLEESIVSLVHEKDIITASIHSLSKKEKDMNDMLSALQKKIDEYSKKKDTLENEIVLVSEDHARVLIPLKDKIENIKKDIVARHRDLMIYEARIKKYYKEIGSDIPAMNVENIEILSQ